MSEWTETARSELENYCQRIRSQVDGSGADADEVVEDLRRHAEAEVERLNLSVVNAEDVARVLKQLGEFDESTDKTPTTEKAQPKPDDEPPKKPGLMLLVFGVVLPVIAIVLETTTRMCTGAFFDPMPTWWHFSLVALVPAANLLVWLLLDHGKPTNREWLAWLNSCAAGICAIYILFFLPLMLPGIIAVIWFGIGFLPWAPCIGLIATLKLRKYIARSLPRPQRRWRLAGGMMFGILLVLILDLPSGTTRLALQWADDDDPATQQRGIKWLRTFGHEETMIRACYERPRRWTDLSAIVASPNNPVHQSEAREIFYRVTGKPFNSVKAPPLFSRSGRVETIDNDFVWEPDNGLGGEAVAGRVRGLSLISSRFDGLVEADAALVYGEWILEFKNESPRQREARAQIALPPGGVVSRLTLWINGEEREAAFGGRSQVREAYQKVAVQQRRDPVLVTTAGPDRVLMQCFPVPPNGGTMKVRVGITAPLHLINREEGAYAWPRFLERNFNLANGLKRSVWMASKGELRSAADALRIVEREDGRTGLQGDLTERELSDPMNILVANRQDGSGRIWTHGIGQTRIEQSIQSITTDAPRKLVVVMDGSVRMANYWSSIADSLGELPESTKLQIVIATDASSDGWIELDDSVRSGTVIEQLRDILPTGGQDNVPALRRGWDLASENAGNVLLWVHAPIPVVLESAEGLRQRLERNAGVVRMHDFQIGNGPNRLIEKLDGLRVQTVLRQRGAEEDFSELVKSLTAESPLLVIRRQQWQGLAGDADVEPASKHVARLWALSEVRALAAQRKFDQAIALAQDYQLVTPLTGAVVLETQAQYEAAGLTPVAAGSVPVVPEPSVLLLLLLGSAVWIVGRKFCRRRATA